MRSSWWMREIPNAAIATATTNAPAATQIAARLFPSRERHHPDGAGGGGAVATGCGDSVGCSIGGSSMNSVCSSFLRGTCENDQGAKTPLRSVAIIAAMVFELFGSDTNEKSPVLPFHATVAFPIR